MIIRETEWEKPNPWKKIHWVARYYECLAFGGITHFSKNERTVYHEERGVELKGNLVDLQ